ncbi:MAG: transposase [Tepidanaerobacteraceae bacterium]|nr:transposase [Tepidanaerobacteraceae bacterium]
MARKPRIHYEGALYHVIVRGNNKAYVFEKDEDKKMYKDIIKRYKKKYLFLIYAYCIMDNHAHLLIEVRNTKLSKIMQGIQQVYTQKYNKKHDRTGHVFEQRYKSILCDRDNYLLELIRYIHQNPIKANASKTIGYKWSSHKEYIGRSELTDTDFILSLFSNKSEDAVRKYLSFMELSDQLGDIGYALDEPMERAHFETNNPMIADDLYWEKVVEYYKVSFQELTKTRLSKEERKRRAIVLLLSKDITDISNKELATLFSITPSGITKILSRINYNDIENEYKELKMSICQA